MSFNVFTGEKNRRLASGAIAAGLAFALVAAPLSGCATAASSGSSDEAAADSTAEAATESSAITAEEAVASSADTKVDVNTFFSSRDLDATWDEATAVLVTLTDDGAAATTADGSVATGVTVEGSTVTITQEGTYVLSGTLTNGSVVVDAPEDAKVQLVLDGASITSASYAAVYAKSADKVFVTLVGDGNSITTSGEFVQTDDNTVDGALFAKCDLTINGEGSLEVSSVDNGIVGKDEVTITGGNVNIDAANDAIQGNDSVAIAAGELTLAAGDDGIHTDGDLVIIGGAVQVTKSEEALEGVTITVTGGTIDVTAADDGLNASGDVPWIEIAGGIIHVSAAGDGIDSNGDLLVTGGVVTVDGPADGGNGAVDYDGQGTIAAGTVIAVGASQMAQTLAPTGDQGVMLVSLSGAAGDTVTLSDADGNVLLSYVAEKNYGCVLLSCADIVDGVSYTVSNGSASVDVQMDGTSYSDVAGGMGQLGGFGAPAADGQQPMGGEPPAAGGQPSMGGEAPTGGMSQNG